MGSALPMQTPVSRLSATASAVDWGKYGNEQLNGDYCGEMPADPASFFSFNPAPAVTAEPDKRPPKDSAIPSLAVSCRFATVMEDRGGRPL